MNGPAARAPKSEAVLATGVALFVFTVTAVGLALMGREMMCPCGEVRLWWGRADGSGNSQHLVDWYSALHVGHGILTWPLLMLLAPRWHWGLYLVTAVVMGAGWEIVENTPFMIDRFGAMGGTSYRGDSIVNSMSDMVFGLIGFAYAARFGLRVALPTLLLLEIAVGLAIADGLLIGTVAFLFPGSAIGAFVGSR